MSESGPSAPRGEEFFSAFRPDREKRPRWLLPSAVGAAALALALMYGFAQPSGDQYQIVTPRGMRVVNLGMSTHEVGRQLGTPIGVELQGGARCLRYGYPSFEEPTFVVHLACFEGEKLTSLTTSRWMAEQIAAPGEPGGLPRPEVIPAQ